MRGMAILPTPLNRTKSRVQQAMEQRIGQPLDQALYRLYIIEGQTQDQIAWAWGLNRATVSRWMRDFGISTRITGPRRAKDLPDIVA